MVLEQIAHVADAGVGDQDVDGRQAPPERQHGALVRHVDDRQLGATRRGAGCASTVARAGGLVAIDHQERAPCAANSSAIALPMPEPAPVTSAFFPSRRNGVVMSFLYRCDDRSAVRSGT